MRIRDLLYETWSALESNRGRSLLTILGIVIGIAAVIAMTALIGGIRNSIIGQLGLDQARVVYISAYSERQLTTDDAPRLEQGLPDYEFITPMIYSWGEMTSSVKKGDGQIQGVEADYFQAMGLKLTDGRSITERDVSQSERIIVIDRNLVKTLFDNPEYDAVGQMVRIGNDQYTIVGVVESDSMYGTGTAYMPITTACTRLIGSKAVNEFVGFAREGADMDAIVSRTASYLASYLGLDEEEAQNYIYVYSMKSMIDSVNATMASFQLLMTTVASISLLVGGIGIMNMMLTNVTERIREIGLRKALGARASDITNQFLLESVAL
ncbi:MAG: ABC transporter permease, partial [Atopobiaceae bacterium]|nr:ABC transporter permease [Atopobiaceae bacterium]